MTENAYPVLGVSTVVVSKAGVMLVKRLKEPAKGKWSLPGGKVEYGEAIADAAIREVREETGLAITRPEFQEFVEVFGDHHHYVIAVFMVDTDGHLVPTAGDDAEDAGWFTDEKMDALIMTPGTRARIRRLVSGFKARL